MSKHKHSYERDEVVEIINSVLSKVDSREGEQAAIFREVKELQRIIEEARQNLSAVRVGDISGKHIPSATDELDAVIEATAEATGTIMDACEMIQSGVAGSPQENAITEQVTKIYEACSFQDITGQRITKVVGSLQSIEEKVETLLLMFGNKVPIDSSEEEDTRSEEEKLLNGPQMADQAISQDDIDKLLESFD